MEYVPQQYSDLYETPIGQGIWDFLTSYQSWIRLETATYLKKPAVEALPPSLIDCFSHEELTPRIRQMIGHMVRQIMEQKGYEIDRNGVKILRKDLFATGTRYRILKGVNDMAAIQEFKYGKYDIKAGQLKGTFTANAFLGKSQITSNTGATLEEAIETTKAALYARDSIKAAKRRKPYIASKEEYMEALQNLNIYDYIMTMFRTHAIAPNQMITTQELADCVGWKQFSAVNMHYGDFAKKIGEYIGLKAKFIEQVGEERFTYFIAEEAEKGEGCDHFIWQMHPEFYEALKELNIA